MDSASENDDLSASFLDSQYSLVQEEEDDDSRDDDDEKPGGVLREQDRFLPIANVARLMKRSIPKTGKIAKDARECVQECVSEFVSFITSEASDRCHQEKRKTINGEDLLFAMSSLGFENYIEPLKLYLQKYREANKGDKLLGGGDALTAQEQSIISLASSSGLTTTEVDQKPLITTSVGSSSLTEGIIFYTATGNASTTNSETLVTNSEFSTSE